MPVFLGAVVGFCVALMGLSILAPDASWDHVVLPAVLVATVVGAVVGASIDSVRRPPR
jgi:hypothetical protein